MITLIDLIESTTWIKPEEHMKVTIWHRDKIYNEGEWEDIELNVKNLAKYGLYYVHDIDVDWCNNGTDIYLGCLICEDM